MIRPTISIRTLPAWIALLSFAPAPASDGADAPPTPAAEQVDMKAMMERARKFTSPGPEHRLLERFLGEWDTEMRIVMPGMKGPGEKGETTFSWLIDGRWISYEGSGSMMGQPAQTFGIIGYDRFKMSYVMTSVGSIDTAMLSSEGDLTRDGKAMILYGTLDEYLTGEHDKMVKYVWRFVSDDEMRLEVHDLPIGETNTKVIEMIYTRKKAVE